MTFLKPFLIELARVAVLAALPILIASLEAGQFDWRTTGIVALVAVLRAIDRSLHDTGIAERGITQF